MAFLRREESEEENCTRQWMKDWRNCSDRHIFQRQQTIFKTMFICVGIHLEIVPFELFSVDEYTWKKKNSLVLPATNRNRLQVRKLVTFRQMDTGNKLTACEDVWAGVSDHWVFEKISAICLAKSNNKNNPKSCLECNLNNPQACLTDHLSQTTKCCYGGCRCCNMNK